MELFRREALDGQDRLHGDIVFVPQISWRLLGAFFAAALAAAALYLFTAQYRPTAAVTGRLALHEGALVATFEVPAEAADGIVAGHSLRLAAAGVPGTLDARIASVVPSSGGKTAIHAVIDERAASLRPGTTVRAAFPGRSRSLAAWLLDDLAVRGPE